MQHLALEQAADYLEAASIEHTHDAGHAIVHIGRNAAGTPFVLVNDALGQTVVIESL